MRYSVSKCLKLGIAAREFMQQNQAIRPQRFLRLVSQNFWRLTPSRPVLGPPHWPEKIQSEPLLIICHRLDGSIREAVS